MAYALIRSGSTNVSGSFRTESEALEALRAAAESGDRALVRDCTLFHVDAQGRWHTVAAGDALLRQVTSARAA